MFAPGEFETGPMRMLEPPGSAGAPEPPGMPGAGELFPVTWRGYDRREVDASIRSLTAELAMARATFEQERQRAVHAECELREALVKLRRHPDTPEGLASWLDELLRRGEEDAARIRANAAADAAAIVAQARAEAEAHRREVEQSLRARAVTLGQEVAKKQLELDAQRQRQLSQQAGAQVAALRTAAEGEAKQLREEAEVRVEELRRRAMALLHHLHETVEQELRRVGAPYEQIRRELARLHDLVMGALSVGRARHEDPYGETADRLASAAEVGAGTIAAGPTAAGGAAPPLTPAG